MPIKDYRFTSVSSDPPRPLLWIRLTNPSTNLRIIALAIIDTGADDCVFPAQAAIQLSHKLNMGTRKTIKTASGQSYVFAHTSRVDILETLPNGMFSSKILYTILDTPVDFVDGCGAFLLGRGKFLNKLVLTIDGPRQRFSIRKPKRRKR